VLAAIVGGYAVTALATAALATFLPLPRADAAIAATMLSFGIYAAIVLWACAVRTVRQAWKGLIVAAVCLEGLLGLRQLLAGI